MWVAATGFAQMATSAPRPPVASRTTATGSSLAGSMTRSGSNGAAIARRARAGLAEDDARAARAGDGNVQASDGSGTHHDHGVTEGRAGRRVGCQDGAERFCQRCLLVAQAGGNGMDDATAQDGRREHEILGEAAVEAGGDPNQAKVIAQVEHAPLAVPALPAVDVRSDGQAVADRVARDLPAHRLDDTGNLVAADERRSVAVRSLAPAAKVGSAHAAGPYGEEETVVRDLRRGDITELNEHGASDVGRLHEDVLPASLWPTAPPGWVSPKRSTV